MVIPSRACVNTLAAKCSFTSACLRSNSRVKLSSAKLISVAIVMSKLHISSSNALVSLLYKVKAPMATPLLRKGSAADAPQPDAKPRSRHAAVRESLKKS